MCARAARIVLTLLGAVPLHAQHMVPESVKVARPNAMAALGGRPVVLRHITPRAGQSSGSSRVDAGDFLGTIEPYPEHMSARHDTTLAHARVLYDERRFDEAATLLEGAYRAEPANLFVLNAFARTLFWIPQRRDQSFRLYKELITTLDQQGATGDSVISLDLWFREAYWKIASLYLDRGDYRSAAFEITRFLVGCSPQDPTTLRQAFDYLVETYYNLRDDEMVRLWAARALRLDPGDAYALHFLYEMGPRATTRALTDLLACRTTPGTPLVVGAYSFLRVRDTLRCIVDRDDEDGTPAPCLRIGEVYVGEGRADVERTLGAPQQSVPQDNGAVAYVYVVFFDRTTGRSGYYVVEYESAAGEQVVKALQLTRDRPPLPLDFSCVLLGDAQDRLTLQLGPPTQTLPFDDPTVHVKGERWSYGALPVSVEIVNRQVYSMRVWRPDRLPPKQRHFKFASPISPPSARALERPS